MTQWKVNQQFKEGKKVFKRGDIIKKRPNWPNFDSMVNSGLLELIEEKLETESSKITEVNNGNL